MPDVSAMNAGVADFIFWFSVVGAGAAAVKHVVRPLAVMQDLSPVAVRNKSSTRSGIGQKEKKERPKAELAASKTEGEVSPEALWWGCYAFSAMNAGYFVNGLWAGYTGSREAKQSVLLGCGVLFECFAVAWLTQGSITGKEDHRKQGTKVAGLGAIFLYGFWLMLNETTDE